MKEETISKVVVYTDATYRDRQEISRSFLWLPQALVTNPLSQAEHDHSVLHFLPALEHVLRLRSVCWHWWHKEKSRGDQVTWKARSSIYLHRYCCGSNFQTGPVSEAGQTIRGTNWNNRKYGSGKFRFPHAEEFAQKLSAIWARTSKRFARRAIDRNKFKEY